MTYKTKVFLAVLAVALLAAPFAAQAFSLVPCGTRTTQPCKFIDLIILLVNLINFLLAASGVVAVYYVVMAGWEMVTSLGNTEKITKGKEGVKNAVVGFAMILLSFAFINLLVHGIFSTTCNWWDQPVKLWQGSGGSCFFS